MSTSYLSLSLFKRSNGIWYVLYDDEGRQRWKSTGCSMKSDALKCLTEFKTLLNSKPKAKSLSVFVQEFLAYASVNYANASVDIFRVALRNLQAVAGNCTLLELTPWHLDQYKTKRLGEVSPVSVNVELRALRTILFIAVRWKLLSDNPFSRAQLVRVPEAEPTYFSEDDFQKLLSLIKEEWLKELILFAVATGMRRAEVLNCQWRNLDLGRRVVHIQSTPSFRVKCGKRRTVPLCEVVVQMLAKRAWSSGEEYVFSLNGQKLSPWFVTHRFKKYVQLSGLNGRLHFHSLRHTFASWLVKDGVSIYEVQKLLGHSSVSTTEIYSHLIASELHCAVNKISVNLN
jgi:integrase